MELEELAELLLIIFSILILLYDFVIDSGTGCLDKLSISMSLFALFYTLFLRIV
jgi:hypothetical protein